MIELRSIPVHYRELTTVYPSLFDLATGLYVYGLRASSHSVNAYVPVATANTQIRFVCTDATAAATVKSKLAAPINGDTALTVTLSAAGNFIDLVPDDDTSPTGWILKTPEGGL